MFRNHRHRRGPYSMAAPSVIPSLIRSIILLTVVAFVLYTAGRWILWLFGSGNQVQRTAVVLTVENRGSVNVSLEGGLLQRAEETLKLYSGDRVTTGGNGNARLQFFDGSLVRFDVQSDATIEESTSGTEQSTFNISLTNGAMWLRTPSISAHSGTVVRTVTTPRYSVIFPSDTEAIVEAQKLMVFTADGQGAEVSFEGMQEPIFIGEGQQYNFPEGTVSGEPYEYRSAIEPLALQRTFVEESRRIDPSEVVNGSSQSSAGEALLTINAPVDNFVTSAPTIVVTGTAGMRVQRIRMNGHDATIDRSDGSFTKELTLEQEGETAITIEALDARGIVIERVVRTVVRGTSSLNLPTITTPAKNGETYRTSKKEFEISGTAPAGVAGIMVNEYALQLFRPGNTSWTYLASTALNNLKEGSNVYNVYALDEKGNKSEPVTITILLETGAEGVVGPSSSASATSTPAQVDEASLPTNDPLMPGTLSVSAPRPGSTYTATGSDLLIEGATAKETASVWVNGYKLRLFQPGRTFWNYIARTDYGTLKRGENVYRIVARNAENMILDVFEYTITYNP